MKLIRAQKSAQSAECLLTTADAALELGLDKNLIKEMKCALERQPVCQMPSLGFSKHAYLIIARKPDWKNENTVRRCFGDLANRAQALAAKTVRVYISAKQSAAIATIAVQGVAQGAYRFDRYLSQKTQAIKTCAIESSLSAKQFKDAVSVAQAVSDCRDLINTPAEDMGPDHFVAAAKRLSRGTGTGIRIRVMDEAACKKAGMGSLLAVGRASHRKPRLLIAEAGPKSKTFKAVCGKGVCFDTGGLGIKGAKGMELMRKDMGGAATVLTALIAAAQQGLKKSVRIYIPLVENSIDGTAFRPGDILKAMDGTTIEVGHTDAEGRLVLADAMCQARKEGAASISTVATLTGAALVALGRIHVPIMGDNDKAIKTLEENAVNCGEKVWRLPLDNDYAKLIKTPNADIKNTGNGEAGCICAGSFLHHFAGGTPFMHCDISPAAWQMASHDLGPVGATGVLVHSLSEFMQA